MNRLAVFVEGHTEAVFVEQLIEEIAGGNNVLIETKAISGGSRAPRRVIQVKAKKPSTGQQFYVLIYDCGGDHQVKPRIVEEHENLTAKGYCKIIGMRDVRPNYSYATLAALEAMLPKYIKTKLAPVEWILAVLEIEAWFLSEASHFGRIDPALTTTSIKAAFGFDPLNDPMDQRVAPAEDLRQCYALVGKQYEKGNAEKTIAALDFAALYVDLSQTIPYLGRLCRSLDDFLQAEQRTEKGAGLA